MSIEEQVIQCVANAYMVDAASIKPETVIREELSPKSMMMLAFISGIENELDATIPPGRSGQSEDRPGLHRQGGGAGRVAVT